MEVKCDGCEQKTPGDDLDFRRARGHILRYCKQCVTIYLQFEGAYNAEAARYQRLLALWAEEMRPKVPLTLTPFDLPELVTDQVGNAIVLQ